MGIGVNIIHLKNFTTEVRMHRLGIKPLSYEARYPIDPLEKIKAVKMGRPKKPFRNP